MIVWRPTNDRRSKDALDLLRALPIRILARVGIRRAVLYERPIPAAQPDRTAPPRTGGQTRPTFP